ncbi:MAG: AraC family transcriptional regulator [Pyrinomonadaceae bacterium]
MQTEANLSLSERNTSASHRQAVERVILEMRAHLADPFSLSEMARIACLSPFHFDRIFHQTTGIPAVQFLYALRIEAAKRLLLTTSLSVTDICYEVGYNSIGTFTSRFTELVGLSPRSFRELAGRFNSSLLETWCSADPDFFSPGKCVTGQLITPSGFEGIVFLGCFATSIPQSYPSGGTVLTSAGPFHIGPVTDGKHFLFAAAFPQTNNPLAFLVPNSSSLLVAAGSRPVTVHAGRSATSVEMRLRPMQSTDPPILISLPFLLATLNSDLFPNVR